MQFSSFPVPWHPSPETDQQGKRGRAKENESKSFFFVRSFNVSLSNSIAIKLLLEILNLMILWEMSLPRELASQRLPHQSIRSFCRKVSFSLSAHSLQRIFNDPPKVEVYLSCYLQLSLIVFSSTSTATSSYSSSFLLASVQRLKESPKN